MARCLWSSLLDMSHHDDQLCLWDHAAAAPSSKRVLVSVYLVLSLNLGCPDLTLRRMALDLFTDDLAVSDHVGSVLEQCELPHSHCIM